MREENYVIKANKFIEAKGRLSTLEQKLLATLISEINTSDEDFKEYKLSISEVGEFIGLNSNAVYERLRETAVNLKSKSLSLEEVNPITKKRTFLEVNLIASAKHTEGTGILIITIAPDLKPYLIAIKGDKTPFTKYMIKNILKLNNSYSIRLYELLKQYERIGKRSFELDELKKLLGVQAESYKIFSEFERRVLKKAKSEISDKTDVYIDYIKHKKGKKIDSITFTIDSKEDYSYIEYLNKTYNIKEFKERAGIEKENFNSKQVIELYEIAVDKMIDDYESADDLFEYIRLNYLFTNDKQGIKNKFSYLKKALQEDYAVARGQIKLNYKI